MTAANFSGAVSSAQPPVHFGTDPRFLVRPDSPDTSVEAAHTVDTTRLESLVYDAVLSFKTGCIQDDVLAQFPGYPYSSITARFRALLDKGLIVDSGERRKGRSGRSQRVLIGVV